MKKERKEGMKNKGNERWLEEREKKGNRKKTNEQTKNKKWKKEKRKKRGITMAKIKKLQIWYMHKF